MVSEETDYVLQGLLWLLKVLIDECHAVKLLVTPIDLKERLESLQEALNLAEGGLNCVRHEPFVVQIERVIKDPQLRVEVERVIDLPRLADNVIPVLELFNVRLELLVLGPALEALDPLKPSLERLDDQFDVLCAAGRRLQPPLVEVGHLPLEDGIRQFLIIGNAIVLCVRVIDNQVSNRVKVLNLRLSARRQDEAVDLLDDLFLLRNRLLVKPNLDVEERFQATRGLQRRRLPVSFANGLDVAAVVQLLKAFNHAPDRVQVDIGQ